MRFTREQLQTIAAAVTGWAGVTSAPHRFGGVEFNLGRVEIGHIHANGMIDIPFTRPLRERLVADGEAEPHHLLDGSGWITFYIRDDAGMTQALRLFRLSYAQKSRRRNPDAPPLGATLAALGFSAALNALLSGAPSDEAADM